MFGPRGAGAHEREEWVGLSDTVDVTRMLVELARRVCA
jgi:di/tripeptidase